MPYCAQADLVERFGTVELQQRTDQVNGATIDASEVAAACDEATSLIDGYLAARYSLPLATVPPVLKRWACDIARFYLWKDLAPEGSAVKMAHDEAIARLKDVARGDFVLAEPDGDTPAQSGAIAIVTSERVFSDDLLGLMP